MFGNNDIFIYYEKIFGIADNTQAASIAELENMLPFELDIYTGLLTRRIRRDAEIRQNAR